MDHNNTWNIFWQYCSPQSLTESRSLHQSIVYTKCNRNTKQAAKKLTPPKKQPEKMEANKPF